MTLSETRAAAAPTKSAAIGTIVGLVSCLAGALLLLVWIQQRVAPAALRIPPVPFFDRFSRWDLAGGFMVAYGLAGLLLLLTGLAILRRMRFAPPAFAICGWGGFLFTAAALIPGQEVKGKLHFALSNAVRLGAVPKEATLSDLIPGRYVVYACLFVGVWLLLLAAGTVHLFRNRDIYNR